MAKMIEAKLVNNRKAKIVTSHITGFIDFSDDEEVNFNTAIELAGGRCFQSLETVEVLVHRFEMTEQE